VKADTIETEPCGCTRMLLADLAIASVSLAIGTALALHIDLALGMFIAALLIFAWLTR
jgi:hypothetical protein